MACLAWLLSSFVLVLQCDITVGCHWTTIHIRNGTWCYPEDDRASDVEDPDFEVSTQAPNITTTTTVPPETTTNPVFRPPVGDCPCGIVEDDGPAPYVERILAQNMETGKDFYRPWLVQILIQKDSGKILECSGSLLNRRWIISAAHCFCGSLVKCSDRAGFKKIYETKNETDKMKERLEESIVIRFLSNSSLDNSTNEENIFEGVEKLVIHPDYYQYTGDTVVGDTDVALLRLNRDAFTLNNQQNVTDQYPWIMPICLPPKLNYRAGKDYTAEDIHEPFEDMDCRLIPESRKSVPYPYNKIDRPKAWLACHPGKLSPNALKTNIAGKTSFITAYGSTARQDVHEIVRYQCTTNSYGPSDSIFEQCHSRCHRNVTEPIEIRMNDNEKMEIEFGNPSLADGVCSRFRRDKLSEASRLYEEETKSNFLGWVKIRKRTTGEEIMCYPHMYREGLKDARSFMEFPYRHGWCEVCKAGNAHDCMARPDKDWGWCQPACDESHNQPETHTYAHEAAVDAFVYENCSKGINAATEFCTGARITGGYGQVWEYGDDGTFTKLKNELRKFTERPLGQHSWQHSSATGDACYGDAGGSVWRYWVFRDNSSVADNRVLKRAVLTGVVSRFEEQCGVFRPDKPVQHTIHTRITSILDWVNEWIADGSCQEED